MGIVYADYAGVTTGEDKDPDTIVFASMVVKTSLGSKLKEREDELIGFLRNLNFKFWPEFEYKAHDILHGRKCKDGTDWRQLDPSQRLKLLKQIRAVILELRLPTAIILIDMHTDWELGLLDLRNTIDSLTPKVLDDDTKGKLTTDFEQQTSVQKIKKEPFGDAISLLFGLTNGLIHERRMGEQNDTFVDNQYLKQIQIWGMVFSELIIYGKSLVQLASPILGVKEKYNPEWYISNNVTDKESYEYFGIQLADYVAYITRRKWIKDDVDISGLSIFSQNQIVPLQFKGRIYTGIHAGICNYHLFDRSDSPEARNRPWIKKHGLWQ